MKRDADIFELIGRSEQIEQAAHAMQAISHPLRLKILCVLGGEEVSVQEIVEAVGTTQSNVSQHLATMRSKGILQTRREANRVFYRVIDNRILDLVLLMREVFCGIPNQRDAESSPTDDPVDPSRSDLT